MALAAQFWLGRYDLLLSDHGNLMVGIDYLQQNFGLPLQTMKAAAAILAAILVIAGRRKLAIACAIVLVVDWLVPPLAASLYVRPNELTLEKPYIVRHIEATRAPTASTSARSVIDFPAQKEGRIDFEANRSLLENVRLWDWRAFTTRSARASRCVPTPTPIPTSTATRSTASCARPCWPRASWI